MHLAFSIHHATAHVIHHAPCAMCHHAPCTHHLPCTMHHHAPCMSNIVSMPAGRHVSCPFKVTTDAILRRLCSHRFIGLLFQVDGVARTIDCTTVVILAFLLFFFVSLPLSCLVFFLGGGLVNLGDCVPWLFLLLYNITEVMIAITDRSVSLTFIATCRFKLYKSST